MAEIGIYKQPIGLGVKNPEESEIIRSLLQFNYWYVPWEERTGAASTRQRTLGHIKRFEDSPQPFECIATQGGDIQLKQTESQCVHNPP